MLQLNVHTWPFHLSFECSEPEANYIDGVLFDVLTDYESCIVLRYVHTCQLLLIALLVTLYLAYKSTCSRRLLFASVSNIR